MSELKELSGWARSEEAFAVALGLDRRELKKFRKEYLEEGIHWVMRRRKVVYREEGEVKMRGLVALLVGSDESEVEVSEEVGREEPELMRVTQVYPGNRRLVECEREGGEKVRVTVGDNLNLMKGMELRARAPWGDSRLWVLVGPRPRWKGKW